MTSRASTVVRHGALVAVALLTLPATAPAAPVRVAQATDLVQGPVLVDGRVAWLEQGRHHYAVNISDGPATTVLAEGSLAYRKGARDLAPSTFEEVAFAISPRRLTVARVRVTGASPDPMVQPASATTTLTSGPLGRPQEPLVSCDARTPLPWEAIAADADAVAYSLCQTGAVTVRDFAPQAPVPSRRVALGGRVAGVDLAGPYLAVQRASQDGFPTTGSLVTLSDVLVRDWVTDTPAFRAPLSPDRFALGADGTLALYQRGYRCLEPGRLMWFSPAMPAGQASRSPCIHDLALSGATVAATVAATVSPAVRLELIAPGGRRRAIADLGRGAMPVGGVDLDGTRAVYALRTCDRRAEIWSVLTTDTPVAPPVTCPVVVRTAHRTVRPDARRVPLRIVCRRGCSGRARLLRRVTCNGRVRRIPLGGWRLFVKAPSQRIRRIGLPLAHSADVLLPAGRSTALLVELRTVDRDGTTHAHAAPLGVTVAGG